MKINKKNAIILVSGGMDSCVTAAQAINDSYKPCFLHVNYGQLTKKRELLTHIKVLYFHTNTQLQLLKASSNCEEL